MDIDGNLCRQSDIAIVISFLSALFTGDDWNRWDRLLRESACRVAARRTLGMVMLTRFMLRLAIAHHFLESLQSRLKVVWAQVWYGNRAEGMNEPWPAGEGRAGSKGGVSRWGEGSHRQARSGVAEHKFPRPLLISLCATAHFVARTRSYISYSS